MSSFRIGLKSWAGAQCLGIAPWSKSSYHKMSVLRTNWSDFTWVGRQYAWWRSIVIATVRKTELKKGAIVSDWGILYFPIFSIGNVMVFQINHLVRKKVDDKWKRGRICGRLSTKVLSFKEMWSLAKTAATKVWRSSMSFPHHWPPELPLLPPNCWGTNKTLLRSYLK